MSKVLLKIKFKIKNNPKQFKGGGHASYNPFNNNCKMRETVKNGWKEEVGDEETDERNEENREETQTGEEEQKGKAKNEERRGKGKEEQKEAENW